MARTEFGCASSTKVEVQRNVSKTPADEAAERKSQLQHWTGQADRIVNQMRGLQLYVQNDGDVSLVRPIRQDLLEKLADVTAHISQLSPAAAQPYINFYQQALSGQNQQLSNITNNAQPPVAPRLWSQPR